MNNLTLRQLRYFDVLAREGHFGRASETCSVTQPALSMQIKELEETLGTPLFERSSRNIRLTAFGQQFALQAREVLKSVDSLGEMARAAKGELGGQFRLGIIPTIAPYLLPGLIGQLGISYPDLEVHVRETQTQTLVEELQLGKLDVALLALPVSEPGLEETDLFSEEFVLVRSVSEKDLPTPDHESLREMKLLLLEEGHCFRDQALSFCSIPTSKPREMMDGSSLSTLVQMVGAGMGVTLLPEMAVDVETRSADVMVQRFDTPKPRRTIGMVWRKTNPLAEQFVHIAELVRNISISERKDMDYDTIDADTFGKSLKGIGLNLLVRDVKRMADFLTDVFGMKGHQVTDDFAIMTYKQDVFQLHSDGTYHSHPLPSLLPESGPRGGGIEIRLYDMDPDKAVADACAHEHASTILQEPADKPHGLREGFILCENGYAWVPSRKL